MKFGDELSSSGRVVVGFFLLILLLPMRLMAQPFAARVEPASTNVMLGASVTFCAEVQGVGLFSYQWQKNGVNLPDQTNQCLSLTNIAVADGGSYHVTVFNGTGALESDEAILSIELDLLPGTDQVGSATFITVASNSVEGLSFASTREVGEPRHYNLSTSNSVWYRWKAPATGIITFDTRGSAFDTVLAVYTGPYLGALVEVTSDDDEGTFHTSKVSWNAQLRSEYLVVIDGVTGETGPYVCNWNLEVTTQRLPVLALRPRSLTVGEGETATFTSAQGENERNLRFQWYHNGVLIPGGTSSNLTIVDVGKADLGSYHLAVTNTSGRGIVTPPVDLEIGPDPTVQSKDKLAEIELSSPSPFAFAASSAAGGSFSLAAGTIINQRFFTGGTTDRCEPAHCGVPGGASRWFQLVADADGICEVNTLGSERDTVLAIYLQNFSICTNLYEPLVTCNNDALGNCQQILSSSGSPDRNSRLTFFATAGAVYRAVVDTVGGVRGAIVEFNIQFDSATSVPTNSIPLTEAPQRLLQLRGSTLSFRVSPQLVTGNSTFEWQFNGRKVAGATLDRLVLSAVNYSDAGRYSVVVRNGAARTVLPGASVMIVDTCRTAAPGLPPVFSLIGTAAEGAVLEATSSLSATSVWEIIGPIQPAFEPVIWDVGTGVSRFYRVSRSPP